MKFTSVIALVATAAAQNPGRDRIVGETCVKTEDRCVDSDKKEQDTLNCCNIMVTLVTTNKQTVCVDTTSKTVTIADGTGVTYGYNCNYVANDFAKSLTAGFAAVASALYLAA